MKKNIVISVGGSLIFGDEININFYKKIRDIFKLNRNEYNFALICGGGKPAREYTNIAKKLSLSEEKQDILGIDATRMNARLMFFVLEGLTTDKIYTDIDSMVNDFGDKITICGGMKPGQRTDKVAALLAKKLNIKTLINLTNVDGVYDRDPNAFSDAKLIKNLNYDRYCELSGLKKHKPSYHFVFDFDAAEICHAKGIKVIIINGNKLENLNSFLAEKEFIGSIIDF
jgi:uridylate kinase